MFEPTVVVAQGSRVPRYLPDSVASALTRVTLKEVAGCYVKVKTIKVLSEDSSEDASPILEIRASEELAYFPLSRASIVLYVRSFLARLPIMSFAFMLVSGMWRAWCLATMTRSPMQPPLPITLKPLCLGE